MDIVKSIRVGLAKRGENQRWLSQSLRISEAAVSNIMTSRKGISLKRLEQIAGLFNVPVSDFIKWGEEP